MTYTVVARCPDTARLGIVIATRAPVVSSRCPIIVPNFGAASCQMISSQPLTQLCGKLMGLGYSAKKVVDELVSSDPHIEYRQIGVVDSAGNSAAYSGSIPEETGYCGHICEKNFVAMGNAILTQNTVTSMAAVMSTRTDLAFADRLMAAIEAGTDAGGQKEGQFSGGIFVYGADQFAEIDLRVDYAHEAVVELRKLYEFWKPLVPYFRERAYNPYMEREDHWLDKRAIEQAN